MTPTAYAEIEFVAKNLGPNPYLDHDVWVEFTSGENVIKRPAYWAGGSRFNVRFASVEGGSWEYQTIGLPGGEEAGTVEVDPARLLKMSPGGRNAVWSDEEPLMVVSDTGWSVPYRATLEETLVYAKDRQVKGFNTALLIVFQPDCGAEGPENRTLPQGFARAFLDSSTRHINEIVPEYFDHLDAQVLTLLEHGLNPIYAPIFFGYGWKGLDVLGWNADPDEARRFMRYLVARFGAWPAMWLVGSDGTGFEPATEAMGLEVEASDSYGQPTGIHYNPWQPSRAHWDAPWNDFHLIQTGHTGEHRPDRLSYLHALQPPRAIANGEPTYEGMGDGKLALGPWHCEESWLNLVAGGTFGVWYGAASLWQWKRPGEESDWASWCAAPWTWREALDLEGSKYPGVIAKVLEGYDFADAEVCNWTCRGARCIAKPGSFALAYLPDGGEVAFGPWADSVRYRMFNALTGDLMNEGRVGITREPYIGQPVAGPKGTPLVFVFGDRKSDLS